jgi:pimeloyl-ACP methyl ester carboxylesterase
MAMSAEEAVRPDLPPAVDAAIVHAGEIPGSRSSVEAAGVRWSVRTWGGHRPATALRPVVLLHGVTSSSRCWWRVGPALAAAGFEAIAPDLPGHGGTSPAPGLRDGEPSAFPFDDAAALVAELMLALDLPVPVRAVVGHSWGALVAARLPAAGARLERLVLLDPPVLDASWARARAADVRRPASREEALDQARVSIPADALDDLEEKAQGLLDLDPVTVRAVFMAGPWDGGLAALAEPRGPVAGGIPTWVIGADPAAGGLLPDEALPGFESLLGPDRVLTVPGSAHSLERSHPRETLALLLRALGS